MARLGSLKSAIGSHTEFHLLNPALQIAKRGMCPVETFEFARIPRKVPNEITRARFPESNECNTLEKNMHISLDDEFL